MMDIDFPDRGYELGGRMDVRIILTPDRDARIRNARVDLVCNQTYTHHSAWKGSTIPRSLGRPMRPGGISVDQRTESYVHSTVEHTRGHLTQGGGHGDTPRRLED